MKKQIFKGSCVAIITPFTPNGDIDLLRFNELIEWHIKNGTDAITVCGTTGESSTLSDAEFELLIDCAVKAAKHCIPIIAGTGSSSTSHSLERSICARELGAAALLIVTPYYNKTTQQGLISHFTYIADRVELPIILYNVPSRTAMSFTSDTYAVLANHPWIYGAKEASGDFNLVLQIRTKCPPDFTIYSGNDDQIIPMLAMGGSGVISVLANVAPADTAKICKLYFEGHGAEAIALQTKYSSLIDALFCETSPIPVKCALQMMGKDSGLLRLPLVEMSLKGKVRLRHELEALGIVF